MPLIFSGAAMLPLVLMKPIFPLLIRTLGLTALTTTSIRSEEPVTMLDEIVVTGNRSDQTLFQQIQPANVLTGADLELKIQPTLGDTLDYLPGVSSTGFAPGASRPVIRGLGEDRVRVLQNGISVLDVSNVSPDHAVSADPLTYQSVEVVRGPATLLYGPNTIGGVVNVIDDLIPEERFSGTYPTGRVEMRGGSADDLFSQSGAITWGAGPIVFHLNGFNREADDVEIPGYARSAALRREDPLPAGTPEARGTLPNSATEAQGAGLGGSYIWANGFLGISYSGMDSDYGTVAEPDVTIGLHQRRWDLLGAVYTPAPGIREINYKIGHSDYDHTEFEGSEVGTVFETDGYNGRIELLHESAGPFEGTVGVESQRSDFSALGDEAFLPPVENQSVSAFVFEEAGSEQWRVQFGARYDHQSNETRTSPAFGPGIDREFDAFSTSAGIIYQPDAEYAVALSLAYTQRPPTYVELFADGPHLATGTFEVGDPDLGKEESLSLDLSVRKRTGRVTGSVSGFYYRFNDFINLQPTGQIDPADSLPIYNYEAIGADFYGGEIETTFHLIETVTAPPTTDAKSPVPSPVPSVDDRLDLLLRADYVHAEDRSNGEPIPRIPPFRLGAALEYERGPFEARLEGQCAAAQNRNADYELPTAGYFLLSASVAYTTEIAGVTTSLFVKGINLTDQQARQSTSFLKDIAPMAGRGVVAGIRAEF